MHLVWFNSEPTLARTGLKLDYLKSEDNTDIPVPVDIYETDSVNVLQRLNTDCKTNKYADNLLPLCKAVPLHIYMYWSQTR